MWQVSEPSLGDRTAVEGATSFFQDMLYFVQVRKMFFFFCALVAVFSLPLLLLLLLLLPLPPPVCTR